MSTSKQAARKESMQQIMSELEAGVVSVFESDNYVKLLDMMSQFHHYSFNNCILILSQFPTASRVASFQTWNRMGFKVKAKSRGIKVLVPIPFKFQKEKETVDKDGNTTMETVDAQGLSFRIGHVFDQSQVEGDFPTIATELKDNSEELQKAVDRIMTEHPDIMYDSALTEGSANGYFSVDTQEIHIRPGMSSSHTLRCILHERAHMLLHSNREPISRETAECQAESVSYICSRSFGLDTSSYSWGYLCSWSSGKELKELKSSLAVIEKAARELMQWLATATDLEMVVPE